MGEIVNLKAARKARGRAAASAQAAESRARHGRTRAERARLRAEQERAARTVDGARLESTEG